MSMHQGIDLSRFKKIASDDKSSTLQHPGGHKIKIAHKGISEAMRASIDSMPVHLAEGGDGETDPAEEEGLAAGDKSGEPIEDDADDDVAFGDSAGERRPPPEVISKPAEPEDDMFQEPTPKPAREAAPMRPVMPTPMPTKQDLDNDTMAVAQDFQRGHIKPETYESLFAKKDTLGKATTLFGLLVSGFGSGLSGQPNAVLEMMKKTIDNDLEAQKQSNSNAQNWYKMGLEHARQKYELPKMAADTEYTKGKTAQLPTEARKMEADITKTKADIEKIPSEIASNWSAAGVNKAQIGLIGNQTAKLGMGMAISQKIEDSLNKYPEGPQRDQAQNIFNTVFKPALMAELGNGNGQTAGGVQLLDTAGGGQKPDSTDPTINPGVDRKKFDLLVLQGQNNAGQGLPGGFQGPLLATALEEAKKVEKNRANYHDFMAAFRELDAAVVAGSLEPMKRAAYIATLAPEISRTVTGQYNPAEAAAVVDGMFPNKLDTDSVRNDKLKNATKFFKRVEADTTVLDNNGLKTKFPEILPTKQEKELTEAKGPKGPKEGDKQTSKSGKPSTFRNGKWTYDIDKRASN